MNGVNESLAKTTIDTVDRDTFQALFSLEFVPTSKKQIHCIKTNLFNNKKLRKYHHHSIHPSQSRDV